MSSHQKPGDPRDIGGQSPGDKAKEKPRANAGAHRDPSKRTQVERRRNEDFRLFFSNNMVPIALWTTDGTVVDANDALLTLIGYTRAELKAGGVRWDAITPPEYRPRDLESLAEVVANGFCAPYEKCYRHKDGHLVPIVIGRGSFDARSGTGVLFALDITERKVSEERLKCLNRTLGMVDECNQIVVRAREETDLLRAVCRVVVEKGGYRMAWVGLAEEDQDKSVRPVAEAGVVEGYLDGIHITWADVERGRGPTGTSIRTGQPIVSSDLLTDPAVAPWREAAIQRGYAASASLPLHWTERVLGALNVYAAKPNRFDLAEVGLLQGLADNLAFGISALRLRAQEKQIREELQALSARLLQVRDEERRHLARELHDTTAQHLAALTLNLTNLGRLITQAPDPAPSLCKQALHLARQSAEEIRTQSYLLHPPLLEALGLAGAVEEWVEEFSARSGMTLEVTLSPDFGRLPGELELALFRIVQESLANVLKHSGCQQAKIRFAREGFFVTLEVQDRGQGMSAEFLARVRHLKSGSGVGLRSMEERLRPFGGRLEIESGPTGTTIRAQVTLDPVVPDHPSI
jgi:PAS domain S-box-containing protein